MSSGANRHASDKEQHDNYTLLQAFYWNCPKEHDGVGRHWNWLGANAPRLAKMGITSAWIPPFYQAASPDSVGYDTKDLWRAQSRYGSRAELEASMKKLRENDIAIYVDAVLGHKCGADDKELFAAHPVDENDRLKEQPAHDIEGWTKFTFPDRTEEEKKLSKMEWHHFNFNGVDYDAKTGEKRVFRIEGKGKSWETDVSKEHGNYQHLLGCSIDHDHPDVREDIFNWAAWVLRTFPVSGFRFDAVKHISRHFISDFVKHAREETRKLRKEQGRPEADESVGPVCFGVGEFWQYSIDECIEYLEKFGEQFSLFDAPLVNNFKQAGDQGSSYDLRKIFDNTIVQKRPMDAVTLVTNHDTQAGQALEAVIAPNFKPLAYAIILLRVDGMPCVFLGDLDGCVEDGDQPATEPMSNLPRFIKSRKHYAYGEQRDYWDHPSCVGWTRAGDEHHDGCAVVLCVGDDEGKKWMEVGGRYKGKTFIDILGWHQGEITVNDDGWAEFVSPAHSCSIWVPKDAVHEDFNE